MTELEFYKLAYQRLYNKVNVVTAEFRHLNQVSRASLVALTNRQLDLDAQFCEFNQQQMAVNVDTATGLDLDHLGASVNVLRKHEETDVDYRVRIKND